MEGDGAERRSEWKLALAYMLLFAGMAPVVGYLNLFLQRRGLSDSQIGTTAAIMSLIPGDISWSRRVRPRSPATPCSASGSPTWCRSPTSPWDWPAPVPPAPSAARQDGAAGGGPRPKYIQLAAVQMRWRLEDYATPARFAARVDDLMRQVAKRLDPRYPALVVFPEDVGILTVLSGEGDALAGAANLQAAVERMVRRHLAAVAWIRVRRGVSWPRAVFLARHEVMARTYLETFSAAARKYGVYLVAGSAPLPEYDLPPDGSLPGDYRALGEAVYNTSYFFGPDGRILGRQKKVHLIELEGPAGLDLVPGSAEEIRAFDTPLGRVGIAICLDAFHADVLDRLQEQGAQILVQPSANPAPWSLEQQRDWLNGSWKATFAEGRFAYAVNPMMVGQVLDLGFFGQSSLVARDPERVAGAAPSLGYADAGPRPGFLAVAPGADAEAVLVVKVPFPSWP
ncbi:MAG: hypothetical protein IMHGJWDQ_001417 [Candidatus Fervidibacter sp.]